MSSIGDIYRRREGRMEKVAEKVDPGDMKVIINNETRQRAEGRGVASELATAMRVVAWLDPSERLKKKERVPKVSTVIAVALKRMRSKIEGLCLSGPCQVEMPGGLRQMRSC
jgi:hypothetical protein